MQRSLLLLVFSSLFYFNLYSQNDYISYYNLTNRANRLWYEKDYSASLALFKEAFSKVEYVHAANYAKAARVAALDKNYGLTKSYLLEAIKRGYSVKITEWPVFKKFRKSVEAEDLLLEIAAARQSTQTSINKDYLHQIDSLHYIDQRILRGNERVGGFEKNEAAEYSDALNFSYLLQLIDRYGFPSEQRLGHRGYGKAWILILHNVRLVQNHYFQPRLLEALKKGEYQPEHYCWVIDQGQEQKGEPLRYYHWDVAKNIDQLSEEERRRIDEERRAVGMASIDRIKVQKTKKSIKNKVRW